jgi:hypothetical protein
MLNHSCGVQVCVAVGMLTAIMWFVWAFMPVRMSAQSSKTVPSGLAAGSTPQQQLVQQRQAHPGRGVLLRFLLLANAALLLEVLDFPPLFSGILVRPGSSCGWHVSALLLCVALVQLGWVHLLLTFRMCGAHVEVHSELDIVQHCRSQRILAHQQVDTQSKPAAATAVLLLCLCLHASSLLVLANGTCARPSFCRMAVST